MIENNEANKAKIREVAEKINGTCRGLDEVLQQVFGDDELTLTEVDVELLRELDDIVTECGVCGWWCDTSEIEDPDQPACEECRKDEADE